MRFYPNYSDNGPIRYVGRVPIYVTTIIVALICLGMLATTMLEAAHGPIGYFEFSTTLFYGHGWVWQMFTAMFVNGPDFFFLFGVFFYYWCAAEIEQFFGRKTFLLLFAANLLVGPVVLGLWSLVVGPAGYAGFYEMCVAMFIAYATLYPNLEYLGWVPLKYIAFACLAIACLGYFPENNWQGLAYMLAICGVNFGFVRYVKLGGSVEWGDWAKKLNPFRRRPKFRVVPTDGRPAPRVDTGGSVASVDAILDKIARDGFASLTQDERDQLERAREILNKKRH